MATTCAASALYLTLGLGLLAFLRAAVRPYDVKQVAHVAQGHRRAVRLLRHVSLLVARHSRQLKCDVERDQYRHSNDHVFQHDIIEPVFRERGVWPFHSFRPPERG
jgi:hypothetical protein